jgi:hypothetical protein
MVKVLKYISIVFILVIVSCLSAAVPVYAAPSITSVNPDSGPYQTTVTVKGAGFTAGDDVAIYFDSQNMVDFTLTSTATSFSKTFTIPSTNKGSHTIYASGSSSGDTALTDFTVEPSITVSSTSGSPGDYVTVYGYGFYASETNIKVTFNGTAVGATKTASTSGYWTNTVTVPSLAAGTYDIGAYGNSTSASEVDNKSYQLIVNSLISLNKTSGIITTPVTISGSGFAPSESGVRITFNGNVVGTTPSVNSGGTWSVSFNIPAMPGGTYVVDAYGNTTSASSVPDLSFTVTPQFTMSPSSGTSGTIVTASGNGYSANEIIPLTFDGAPIGAGVNADSTGSWTTSFPIPVSSSGAHRIGAGSAVPPLSFTTGSTLSANKTSGIAGTSVTVTGSSFAANETGITVTFDGNPLGSAVTASSTGAWSATVTIPQTFGGDHSIGARGKTTPATAVSESTFTVLPVLSPLSKTTGPAGTSVTLSGTSFAPAEKIIINYDGVAIEQTTTTDDNGAWSSTFKIPPSPAGSHTIKVSGSISGAINLGALTFKIAVGISLDPVKGTVGQPVNVSGTGFTAQSPLKITWDDAAISGLAAVIVRESGEFTFSFKIPRSKAGLHTIKVVDNQNNTEKVDFQIDNTPPTGPKPVSPADGETIGFTGNINPTFTWSKSTGTSEITYIVQISNDEEFSNPQIEKTDLTTTKYTLARSETLVNGEYYWRVKAVDAAANESGWSRPYLLKSGVISSALLTLLIIVGIFILAAAAYFLIIRPLRKRRAQRALAGAGPSEIIVPEVVNAEYRTLDTDEAGKRKALPWRLALPQSSAPAKGPKTLSSEDQARLKVIIEFAKSLPLVEPGYNTNWLVEMAESGAGSAASPALYAQMLKGELQIQYEPAWMRHPTFMDLQTLLEGQPIIQDLNSFVESVNSSATDGMLLLQDIYREITAEITWDILADGGWEFISAVYIDSVTWYQGKNLREPSDKDYSVKTVGNPGDGTGMFGLYAEQVTAFPGLLVKTMDESESAKLRTLHIKLRKNFRNNERAGDIVHLLTQLEVQRGRLINAFSQFSKLNP